MRSCAAGRSTATSGSAPASPAASSPRPPWRRPGILTALCLDAGLILEPDVTACRDAGLDCYVGVVPDAAEARRLAAWRPTALVMGSDFDF